LNFKVVKVCWVDPHSVDEWTDYDSDEVQKVLDCESSGYLVHESKESITLALNLGLGNDQISCTLVLPRCCITSIQEYELRPAPYSSQ